ncbi:MAG TPA: flavin reductase family protein [Gemmatimonadales bacterium]|nr:flavin reductase family protein [Gemmatimonadales bacterium]
MLVQAETYFYEPAKGHGLPHDPFKAIVAPRPIGWISTRDRDGRVNLAPYSFFNAFGAYPPIVAFGSEGYKDSVRNIEATGEFVTNFVTRPLAEQMNRTSAPVGPEIDELTLAGLEAAPCRLVAAPRVAAAPAALECKLLQIIRLHDLEGRALENYLTLGQVVGVHIDPRYLVDGIFDLAAAQPIMRGGYQADYAEIGPLFRMIRPTK